MSVIRVQIASHAYSLRESPTTRQANLYYFRVEKKQRILWLRKEIARIDKIPNNLCNFVLESKKRTT